MAAREEGLEGAVGLAWRAQYRDGIGPGNLARARARVARRSAIATRCATLGSPRAREAIAAARADLAGAAWRCCRASCAPTRSRALIEECDALAPCGHFSEVHGTPYIDVPDVSLPEGHPRRTLGRTALTAVAYDRFPAGERPARALRVGSADGLRARDARARAPVPLRRSARRAESRGHARRRRAGLALRPDRLRGLARDPVERGRRRVRVRAVDPQRRRRALRRRREGAAPAIRTRA